MRVLVMGGSGMVGQGVLRECLRSPEVSEVVAPVRQPFAQENAKLRKVVRTDFFNWGGFDLAGFDACFFCLGVSAVGKTEAEYRRITYDLALALARPLAAASPQATLVYVSGAGTDAHGRSMWARVKGETENALRDLPFLAVFCFRPGYIQPLHGIRSKVGWYQRLYDFGGWIYPLLRRLPGAGTSTEEVGLAMLEVASRGWQEAVLGNAAIDAAAEERRALPPKEEAPHR